MANNEDYLDKLLKAAESQDNPNSAINKVRQIERANQEAAEARKKEERLAEEARQKEEERLAEEARQKEEERLAEEARLAEEVSVNEETKLDEEIQTSTESVSLEADISESPLAVNEEPYDEDAQSVEESPITDASYEEKENVSGEVSESFVDNDIAALLDGMEVQPDESDADTENTDEIDKLLKSDFSGEVEMPEEDIEALLKSAEAFANESAETPESSEESSPSKNAESNDASDDPLAELSAEDITKMLNVELGIHEDEKQGEIEVDVSDISALEGELGIFDKNDVLSVGDGLTEDSGELDEISRLLKTIDSNDVSAVSDDDMLSMLNEAVINQEEMESIASKEKDREDTDPEYSEEKEDEKKKKKKKKLFGKKNKENSDEDEESETGEEDGEKHSKKSFLSRAIDFLTASDEDDEESENLINPIDAAPEAKEENFEDVPGENKEILNEMDNEGEEDGKGKKKKKKKKGKKDNAEGASDDESDEGEGETESGKKKKKEKASKEPLVLDIDTGKPLSKRNVRLIAVLAATVLLLIILINKFIPGTLEHAAARKAYYKGDYETVYTSFYGEKLSKSDQIMFDKSFVILKVTHKYDAFRSYYKIDMKVEALDQLLQAVANYEKWLILAETYGAVSEYNNAYQTILDSLAVTFGMTETEAKAVIALPTDLEYSLKCYSIVNGTDYIDPNEPLPAAFVPPVVENEEEIQYEDVLAEEGN